MSFSCRLNYQVLNRLDKESLIQILIARSLQELSNEVEWYPVSTIAELRGITPDGVRKQVQNGDFEEGIDFKYNGSRILINQGAIERIHRKRRSSNG